MAIAYGLLNGFTRNFFLRAFDLSKDKYEWWSWSFNHCPCVLPYLSGYLWALVIGVVFGLFIISLYKYKVKNLLPFFLMHALAGYGSRVHLSLW